MREMKSSGLPWVDNIPEGWKIARGKEILTLLSRPVEPTDGVITCFRDGEVTLRSKRRELGFTFSTQETGYQGIEPGDLVIHGMDGFAGSIGISDSRGKATPVLNVMDSNQNKKYLMYYFRAIAKAGYFESVATGIRVRTCDTNWNKISVTPCLVPPLDEQSRIASFLDSHIAKIDDSIARYKALSDKLDEYRYNVISKITCVGIREKKLFTPLNNEFLDRLPKDWEYKRLKFTSVEIFKGDGITKDEVDVNGNIPCIRYGEIYSKYDIACSKCYSLTNLEAHTSPKYAVYGDLLLAGTGELIEDIGKNIVYLGSQPCLVGGDIIVVRHNQNPKFLSYALNSHYARAQKSKGKSKLKVVHISASEIGNIRVAIPPLDEQAEIVAYLDKKCSDIDSSKEKIEAVVKKLEEYKKSLIYNAVTGKIEC